MEQEAIKQRRRDKILARINDPKATQQQQSAQSEELTEKTNVFNRFANLKRKQSTDKQLSLYARFSGIVIAAIQLLVYPSGWVYFGVLTIFSILLFCNERSELNEASDSLDRLLRGYLPVLGGLGVVQKVLKGVNMFITLTASTILFGIVLAYLTQGFIS